MNSNVLVSIHLRHMRRRPRCNGIYWNHMDAHTPLRIRCRSANQSINQSINLISINHIIQSYRSAEKLPRRPDPKSRAPLNIRPRNLEEERLFQEFRRICGKDDYEYMDLFKPIIERVVRDDNPQAHFKFIGDQMVLSKNLPSARALPMNPRANQIICPQCRGTGCPRCGNDGWVTEEPAP